MTAEETQYYNALKANRNLNDYVFDKLFAIINGHTIDKPNVALQLVGGVPMVINSFADNNIFAGLFPQGLTAPSFNENAFSNTQNQQSYISPFLKKYLRSDGIPIKLPENTTIFEHPDGYEVNFVNFDKGSSMLDYHNNENPKKNEMWILYEQDNPNKSNLFGSFVLAKTGEGYLKLLNNLKNKKTTVFSHINNDTGIILNSFQDELKDDYNSLLKRTKNISKEKLDFAIETEMRVNSNTEKMLKSIFGGLDGIVADVTDGINDGIESIKFTKEDYTPEKKEGDLDLGDYLEKLIEINQEIIETVVDYAIPGKIHKQLSKSFNDFIAEASKVATKNLPKETLAFFEKAYQMLQETLAFFKEAAKYFASLAGDSLYLIKAFLMGFVNGLLSTIQTIISLVGWLLTGNVDKKLTGQHFQEIQSKFEFIEDLIDLMSESTKSFFEAINNLLKDFSIEKFKDLLTVFKEKASQINRFDVAFFAGSLIFEVVLGVVLAIFTGGATAVAEAANAAEKASALVKLFLREALSTATIGIVDVLQLIKTLIANFVKACQKGWKGLKEFLKKIIAENTDEIILIDKIDDLLLPLIKILKQNPSFIKCINLVKENRVFGKYLVIELEATIKLYTGQTYIILNKALRGLEGVILDKELKAIQKILDNALEKLPISKYNNKEIFRSSYFSESDIKKFFKSGKDFTEKGFMSATYSDEALKVWLQDNPSHNVVFKIFGKNGKLIEDASLLPHEAEILFKSNTTFVVDGIRKIDHPLDKSKLITEIILKEK